jgi:antitoxin component YwqK of YwqJK toxin-antitoxin module
MCRNNNLKMQNYLSVYFRLSINHFAAFRLSIVFIAIFSFFGCKQKSVKVVARTKSGTPSVVLEYPDRSDTLTYTIKVYYPEGKLHKEAQVQDGKYVGEKITYFPNGKIYQIDSLSTPCDKLLYLCDGVLIRYNENGSISQRFEVKNGQFNGLSKHYDEQGILVKTYYLKDDSIKDGEYLEYFKNGKIAGRANYRNDTLIGMEYGFNENGDTLIYYSHHAGKLDLPFKKWLPNGNTLYGIRLNGDSVLWTWYDKNGRVLKLEKVGATKSGYLIPD